jgi:putative transposase
VGADGYTASELAGLPGMPPSVRHVQLRAKREAWPYVERANNGGVARVYLAQSLPAETLAAIARRARPTDQQIELASLGSDHAASFVAASPKLREVAMRRAQAVTTLRSLIASGARRSHALDLVAAEQGESPRTIQRWDAAVRGLAAGDWACVLLPQYRGSTALEAVHPDAWNWILSDYLRPARPAFRACYRRLVEHAQAQGWEPVPSIWSLQRRLDREVAPSIVVLRRQGLEAYLRMLPSQRRDKSGLAALEWVNADGHKLDVFASWPMRDGSVRIARPVVVAWQDVASAKLLAWRIDETENTDAVRLAFADMVRDWGIPERITVDNGHAFAGKEMTGGLVNRHRFGPGDDDELDGIYRAFGVREVHFALPYHGQAKPIERAFRDLCEEISRHPLCQGAYTGNRVDAKPEDYGSRAIPIADLVAHVGREIARHNARTDRESAACRGGRSFDAVFEASYADPTRVIRRATEAQIRWLLMPSKPLKVSRLETTITLLGNRYRHPALIDLAGETVAVRYDPHDLQGGVYVFRPGELEPLCHAPCIAAVGFGDTDAARRTARARAAEVKAAKAAAAVLGTVPIAELGGAPATRKKRPATKVVEVKFGRAARPAIAAGPVAPAAEPPSSGDDFLEREFRRFEREREAAG